MTDLTSPPPAPGEKDGVVPVPAVTRTVRTSTTPVAVIALVAATVVWGSTFLVTKEALGTTPAASFLVWRFGLAAVVLALVRPGGVGGLTPDDRRRGLLLGAFLGAGFLLQTLGLRGTAAGVSGFLTGTAVVLTPVVAAAWFRRRVGGAGWVAVAVATAGIAVMSLRDVALSPPALLTLGGAACFAVHISSLSQWATRDNAVGLTTVSVAVAAVLCGVVAALGEGLDVPSGWPGWRSVVYLAVGATCLGFVVQAWAQSVLHATTAAVVMTMEPVFAAALAATAGDESLGTSVWVGGILVVASMFVAELGPRECCDAMAPRVECC
jgi:drug/metabolite transporter (DMT)-like permease